MNNTNGERERPGVRRALEGPLILLRVQAKFRFVVLGWVTNLRKLHWTLREMCNMECKFRKLVTKSLKKKRAVGRKDSFGLPWPVSSF